MKLREIIKHIKKNKDNENWTDLDLFCQELDLHSPWGYYTKFTERVKGYYILNWMCTDTVVGLCAYFLDDEFIALGAQTARKNTEQLTFASPDAQKKVRSFILSLTEEDEPAVEFLDLDEEFDELFSVHYSSQVQVLEGFYQGVPVKVKEKCWGYNTDPGKGLTMDQIKLEFPDGSDKIVPCEDYMMKINVENIQ